MKLSRPFPEDLAVLARRGRLRSDQHQLLEHALQSSATLRVTASVGHAFDQVAQVHEGDEQRIAEWVDAVMLRRRTPRPQLGWRFALAAAIVFVTASAAGLAGWRYAPRVREVVTHGTAPSPLPTHREKAERRVAFETPIPSCTAPPVAAPLATDPSKDGSASTPRAPASGRAIAVFVNEPRGELRRLVPPADSTKPATAMPGELLSRANAARRDGQLELASALYVELQRSFAGSAEANMSRVSLGRLLVVRGQPAQALVQFTEYLAAGGSLQEEALLGKAQSLSRLGRKTEERAVWRELLSRFPDSVYATEAKEQLGEQQ